MMILSGRTAVALAAVVAVCVAYLAVWWGGLNQDEGWYLYASRLVAEGKLPYRDFFFTQGPVLPFVYSVLPVHGLLSGRLATYGFSIAATAVSIAFARSLVPVGRRRAVSLAVFSMLACNLYHVYFTSIPKTYALGALLVMSGFLFLSRGWNFLSAMSFAFASGTRISLVLILGVAGVWLLATRFRSLDWLWFGIGGVIGLFLVYGAFSLDPASLRGLLAAQAYHAGRGDADPFFALGAVSRLVRGYLPLGALLFAAFAVGGGDSSAGEKPPRCASRLMWIAGTSFACVFLLQMSAPYPYDDYEVPIMPILAVLISVWFVNRASSLAGGGRIARAWLPVLVSGMCAFSSPLVQDWMTDGIDRFWALRKERPELAVLRDTARRLEKLDPGGTMLLTQDLYLAVEMGRKVPEGLEMGPFSYFPGISSADAEALHVMNSERLEKLLESSPCRLAAFSGYGFAIEVPRGSRTPEGDRNRFIDVLRRSYGRKVLEVPGFGQNHTLLQCFMRNGE